MIDFNFIRENIDEFSYSNVLLSAASQDGIAVDIFVPVDIDLLDFIEELGIFFYRIDDPKFGQKFINEDTKGYIYDWLVQMLNTANYDEDESTGDMIASLELYIDFDKVNTFKYALRKYKEKLKKPEYKQSKEKMFALQTAISILEIVEKIRLRIE